MLDPAALRVQPHVGRELPGVWCNGDLSILIDRRETCCDASQERSAKIAVYTSIQMPWLVQRKTTRLRFLNGDQLNLMGGTEALPAPHDDNASKFFGHSTIPSDRLY